MLIELKKFGTTLVSRQTGREAWAAFQPALHALSPKEKLEVSFDDILTFSPSWADEFLTPLQKEFGRRVVLRETSNPSVKATLDILEIR
ncbi:DUF4325 domain-containing protein [Patescibacteria group bacterium]|nr:DUF4325 domain-containing protein [Patescibacteria group bacterium]